MSRLLLVMSHAAGHASATPMPARNPNFLPAALYCVGEGKLSESTLALERAMYYGAANEAAYADQSTIGARLAALQNVRRQTVASAQSRSMAAAAAVASTSAATAPAAANTASTAPSSGGGSATTSNVVLNALAKAVTQALLHAPRAGAVTLSSSSGGGGGADAAAAGAGAGMSASPSPPAPVAGAAGVTVPVSSEPDPLMRQQSARLMQLYHAMRCTASGVEGQCQFPQHCAYFRSTMAHFRICKNPACAVRHCVSSRYCMEHYRTCQLQRAQQPPCAVCEPVRATIQQWDAARVRAAAEVRAPADTGGGSSTSETPDATDSTVMVVKRPMPSGADVGGPTKRPRLVDGGAADGAAAPDASAPNATFAELYEKSHPSVWEKLTPVEQVRRTHGSAAAYASPMQ